MTSPWITALITAIITGTAAAHGSRIIQDYKATGQTPFDDFGHSFKQAAYSPVVVGPLVEAAAGDAEWGDAGVKAGIQAGGLALSAGAGGLLAGAGEAATAPVAATAETVNAANQAVGNGIAGGILENAGTIAGEAGSAGAHTLPETASAIGTEVARGAAQSAVPAGARTEFVTPLAEVAQAAPPAPPLGPVGTSFPAPPVSPDMPGPSFLDQAFNPEHGKGLFAEHIGRLPTDVLRNTAGGAAKGLLGQVGEENPDFGAGAFLGAASGGVGALSASALQGIAPTEQYVPTRGLVPGSSIDAELNYTPVPGADPFTASTPALGAELQGTGLLDAASSYAGGYGNDAAFSIEQNPGAALAHGPANSVINRAAMQPLQNQFGPKPPPPPAPYLDPYAYFRELPGLNRRRLV